MKKKTPARQFELSQLTNSSKNPILDNQLSEGFKNPVVKNVTEHIDTKTPQRILSGSDFTEKIAKLRALKSLGTKALGAVPVLGGLASAAMSQDASAAIPVLDSAEPLGPAKGSLDE